MRLRLRPLLAVTAGLLALSFVNLSTASAAPGFVRMDRALLHIDIADPKAGQCYTGLGQGTDISNVTIGTILLFPDKTCSTQVFNPLDSGESRVANVGSFMPLD
ncbi:hypothetical protein AB0O91_16890 [Kitasatospora sp. NPDC089797]|uniref:hypothetical protein n=1 Tax=Kitasatospora sp. NPDC089797 TaxID=3155298 RepID=UPI003442756E